MKGKLIMGIIITLTALIIIVTPLEAQWFQITKIQMYVTNIIEAAMFLFGIWVGTLILQLDQIVKKESEEQWMNLKNI